VRGLRRWVTRLRVVSRFAYEKVVAAAVARKYSPAKMNALNEGLLSRVAIERSLGK
jgi:hypothetical protein